MQSYSQTRHSFRAKGELAFTRHGKTRQQQRCIPQCIVEALIDFGTERFAGGGTRSFSFTKRTWRQFSAYMGRDVRAYERYRDVYLVLAEDGSIITVAWRH